MGRELKSGPYNIYIYICVCVCVFVCARTRVCMNILYDLFCFVRLRSNNIDCCSQGMLLSITSQFSSYLKVFFFFFSFKYALVIT